jgi:signal transduction histidine kinase
MPSAGDDDTPLPLRKSLRGKGLFATLALLAYVLVAGLYVAHERAKILDSVAALERLAQHEKAVALAEAAVNGALVDVNSASNAALPEPAMPSEIALYMESCAKLFSALDEFDPAYALLQRAMQRSYQSLVASPQRANWIELRESMGRAGDELEIRRRRLVEERDALTLGYQRQYDAVTVESLLLAVIGLAMFGSLAAWFFSRLAGDIRRLEGHARQIVHGTRGVALPVHREDELGHLMRAVNRMATDLDEREKQIELDGQRRAHQDKMLSVGALAAGIAHEVNNPLAAISGAAQALRQADGAPTAQQIEDNTQLILAQAERASRAARQLAEVSAAETAERNLIDLNALLRRVVQLNGYDRRYRHLNFATALDPSLPAVKTAGDALRHVLMQIVTVACDALVATGQHRATIEMATAAEGPDITVRMSLPAVLDFTQPELQRALLISRALIEPQGGRLAFGQDEAGLLRFKLTLPAESGEEST